jgi:IMP cyclohydrolase
MAYMGRCAGASRIDAVPRKTYNIISHDPEYVIHNKLFKAPYCFFIDTERGERKDGLRAVPVEGDEFSAIKIESLYDENFVPYDAIIARHGGKTGTDGIAVVADGVHGYDILKLIDEGKCYIDALQDGLPAEVETDEGNIVKPKIGLILNHKGNGALGLFNKEERYYMTFSTNPMILPYVSTYGEKSGEENRTVSASAPSSIFIPHNALKLEGEDLQELSEKLYKYLKDNECGRFLNSVSCAVWRDNKEKWDVVSTNRVKGPSVSMSS